MTHYEITFKMRYESPFGQFTMAHQGITISQWCNWNRDYIELSSQRPLDKKIQGEVQHLAGEMGFKINRKSISENSFGVVFSHCICDKVTSPALLTIDRFNCLEMQPYVFQEGSELCRVIAFSQSDIRKLFSTLGEYEIEVLSRSEVEEDVVRGNLNLSSSTLLGDLTSKQKQALRTALDIGYYKKPRGATATKVARAMGIPRTSFVDHLRKAENKVLNSLQPFLNLETN